MKRFIAIFLTLSIILSTFVFMPTVLAEENTDLADYSWSGTTTVFKASANVRGIRTKLLSDGYVGAVYYRSGSGNYFAKSYDGGITFEKETLLIANATDSELENSPFVDEENPYGRGRLEAQNPNFIETTDGKLMAFYRYNTYTGEPNAKPWSFYYASICYQISDDGGVSWSEPKVMVECTKEKAIDSTSSDYGLWEPDPYYINGKLFVYYADTYTPNNLSYQHIMYCVWNEETETFSAPQIAQNGIDHLSRDGMSVVTELQDGSYAMVFESTRTANSSNTFVIKMSLSKDGMNWTHPVIVATPNKVLESSAASSSEKAVCAAPYIITLPDGRVAISYQTTDCYSGIIPDRVSYRIGTQVAVSKEAITYDSFADISGFADTNNNANVSSYFTEIADGPQQKKDNEFSKSASLLYANGKLMVYYNIGTNIDADTHIIGAIVVGYADTDNATDYRTLSNYTALNHKNREITDTDGVFTLPSSTSTILATDKTASVELEDLYNVGNYTLYSSGSYSAEFDSTNKTVKTASTGKALLNDTEDMTSFSASVKVSGNSSTGAIQGGFGFHLQDADFETNYFNTSGYSVFVRRQTTNLSTVEIVYRYCTGGANVYSYVAGSYKGLSENELDLEFTLELYVNEDKFYALLKDESGKVIINAKEAPLIETESEKEPDYYPTGSIALISHGTHTFSNISITKTSELIKTDYLRARAIFTTAPTGDNQVGFALRAQGSVKGSPGYSGYVVKLVKKDSSPDGQISLQLTRYGTNSSGVKFQNLGNMKTYTDTTVLGGEHASGATLIMEAEAEGSLLTVTLTNPTDRSLTSTYEFDLTKTSGSYSDYYATGGFGIFNHGSTEVSVSGVEFYTEKERDYSINDADFTVFDSSTNNTLLYDNNSFVATEATGKKLMLKDVFAADLDADVTFEIGSDGYLKGGIILRADTVGSGRNSLEGYGAVVARNGDNINKGRLHLMIYKWTRTADGTPAYYYHLKRLYDTDTLNSYLPEAETSLLAAANTKLKLYASINGNNLSTYFEILDDDGNVAATSPTLSYDISTKRTPSATSQFGYDNANTLYGAGEVGIWMSEKGRICDFNLDIKDDAQELESKLLTTDYNHNGLLYTTLCSGAAEDGSAVKLIVKANTGAKLSVLQVWQNGELKEYNVKDGEYSFTKPSGSLKFNAIFKIIGDITGDDLINATDLGVLRSYLLGHGDIRMSDGDITDNGSIDVVDLVRLKKLAAE